MKQSSAVIYKCKINKFTKAVVALASIGGVITSALYMFGPAAELVFL